MQININNWKHLSADHPCMEPNASYWSSNNQRFEASHLPVSICLQTQQSHDSNCCTQAYLLISFLKTMNSQWWWWWSYENQCDMSVSKRLLEESLEVLWTECYDYINQDENANLNKSIYDNNFLSQKTWKKNCISSQLFHFQIWALHEKYHNLQFLRVSCMPICLVKTFLFSGDLL